MLRLSADSGGVGLNQQLGELGRAQHRQITEHRSSRRKRRSRSVIVIVIIIITRWRSFQVIGEVDLHSFPTTGGRSLRRRRRRRRKAARCREWP